MKLAEALIARADAQRRLEQLKNRLSLSVVVQEGEDPPEDPAELLAEVARLTGELTRLIPQINRTNLSVRLENGQTLTEALARRDVLELHYGLVRQVADAASERPNRYGLAEIRQVVTVNVGQLRRELDGLAQQRRELDTLIQEANWTHELVI